MNLFYFFLCQVSWKIILPCSGTAVACRFIHILSTIQSTWIINHPSSIKSNCYYTQSTKNILTYDKLACVCCNACTREYIYNIHNLPILCVVYFEAYLIRSSLVINQSRLGITSSFMFQNEIFSWYTDDKKEIEHLTGAETLYLWYALVPTWTYTVHVHYNSIWFDYTCGNRKLLS